MSHTPKFAKKFQNWEYKVDLLVDELVNKDNLYLDDYYDEEYYDKPYDIEDYDYAVFKEGLLDHNSTKELQKGELEDLENLKAEDLPKILSKISPQYIVRNQSDFYSKSRIICENGFNLKFTERVDYFSRFLWQYNQSQNRSIFVKRLLQVTIEKWNDKEINLTWDVLKRMFLDSVFTKQQLRRGLDRIYMDIENMIDDAPNLHEDLAKIILDLVKDKILTNQVLLKIPPEDRSKIALHQPFAEYFSKELESLNQEEEIWQRFKELILMYFENFDSSEIIDFFKNWPYHEITKPWFIRDSILIACGSGNNEREKISQLLKEIAKGLDLKFAVFSNAYDMLIENCSDYILDIPHFTDYVSIFIARAIYDGCFNAMYILHAETFDSEDTNQLKIIKNACSYLSLNPVDAHLKNIWGCAISNKELCEHFESIIKEFDASSDCANTFDKLKELECDFYYHEFVKRLVLFYVNLMSQDVVNYEVIHTLLTYLLNNLLLTKSQLEVGIKNARHEVTILSQHDHNLIKNMRVIHNECLSKIKISGD